MSTNPLAGERSTRIPSEDGAPLTVKSFTAHCSSFLKQAIVIGLRNARPLKDAAECYGTAAWNWLLDLVRKFLELKPSALLAAFIAATTRSDSPVVRWIGQQLLKIPGAERIVAVVSKFVSKCAKILVKGLETLTKWWKVMSSYLPSTAVEKIEECAAWLASKASSFPFKSALRWLSAFLSLWAFATDAYSLVSGSYQAVLDQLKAGLGATDIPAVQDLRADLARLQESMNEMAGRLQALLSSPVPEDAGRASDLLEILTLRFE